MWLDQINLAGRVRERTQRSRTSLSVWEDRETGKPWELDYGQVLTELKRAEDLLLENERGGLPE